MDNGELKQCSICGDVFACGGYSVTLEDLSQVLQTLHYAVICPTCYAVILRAIVIRESEGRMRHGEKIFDRCSVCREAQHTETDGQRMDKEGEIESS
jgi:hypothetical protein